MTSSQTNVERFHTVVIGAGQNGLGIGYYLAKSGVDFVIVDGAERIGDSWRKRWDSLRLFTWAYFNDLPGMPFPGEDRNHLPSKDEAADYLEQYAAKFSLPVELGVKVERLSREGDRYVVDAGTRRFEAQNVVVATGPFQKPRIPAFASELDSSIKQIHSSAYRNPSQMQDGDALVVGAATSGSEIAMELAKTRKVYLAGRDVDAVPPGKAKILRHVIPWVYSRPRSSFIGKKLFVKARTGGHPLINFSYKDVKRAGVERLPRITGVSDGKPQLEDGRTFDVANVVWATGYDVDFSWVDLPVFEEDGYPRHERGVVEDSPGLYFVGLIFLHSLSSQLFMGVDRDTKHGTDELLRRSKADVAAAPEEPSRRAGASSI